MDQYLTNGGRSVPKVIATDQAGNHLGDWGPRPLEAQRIYDDWRNSEVRAPYQEIQITLQKWYNQDKDLDSLINSIASSEIRLILPSRPTFLENIQILTLTC